MPSCKNCSADLQKGYEFCHLCGSLVESSEDHGIPVECETHPDQRAIGICVVCGRPLCSECGIKRTGKFLCDDPEHTILLQDWCVMLQPDSEFEAEAVVRNLADGGIEVKAFSLHDHVAASWLKENSVLVFVRTSEHEKAKTLLKELNLIDLN